MDTILECKGYGFQYRSQAKPTLSGVNLTLRKGEKVLVVGPSGSGKSTLANCINGLAPFSYPGEYTGSLKVAGQEAGESSIFTLSKTVGTVLQDPDGQFIGLTVGEDIAFSLENECVPQDEMKRRVQKAAELVSIDTHLQASPHNLSGGQKQRVSMAGVLVDEVDVLLFDEPLANLDPATGKQAIELIDQIQKDTGTTVLIIEHRLEDVLFRSVDRIILVNHGGIVADMRPDELLCTSLLKDAGIREPLYLTALRYAGVECAPEDKPAHIDTVQLTDARREQVRRWFSETSPPAAEKHTEALLEVRDLRFGYTEERTVLEDVSFTLHKGEVVAIVGENGAGKSTLSKLICGFETPDEGSVWMHGRDLANDNIVERARSIGYVMQNPNQMISKTMIFEEVALGLQKSGLSEEEIRTRVEDTLKVCGLYPFRNWPISALSFGQKKRVTIASVLVLQPEILLLDEPTAGQDFRHYTDIMEFLEKLNKTGVTVVMVTHDMHLMQEYAGRALVFAGGRMVADTTPAAVLTNPALAAQASLKETSLFGLAQRCGIEDGLGFVQHFIDYDREVRQHEPQE